MTNHTIRSAWDSYRRAVLPATAPAIQIQECRRAFYAGAEGLYVRIMTGLEPGPDATGGDLTFLAELDRELRDFARSVAEGRV